MAGNGSGTGLPTGTVTMLFTDIEGSTHTLRSLGDRYADALGRHRLLVRAACDAHDGHEVDTQGDAFLVVFSRATDAVAAAAEAQRALAAEPWPDGTAVRVRMGVHTGEPELHDEGYVGLDVHLAARICAVAHGGQVLLSQATRDLVGHEPFAGGSARDLGYHRLKDFDRPERLFQLEGPGLDPEHPPPRTGSAVGLIVPSNRLVGRERELTALSELAARTDVRLVTLTGPGGAGKSRLALEHAWSAVERHADGVVLVRLAPVSDAELVPSAIAAALGVRDPRGRPLLDAVAEHLRDRDVLLLLDNFEHVIEAAPLVVLLFERAPRLRVLVTSRSPLRLRGEHLVDVEPLPHADARDLFVERAQAADHRFDPDDDGDAIDEICRRLDGLPLAIELAAARIAVLSPAALLQRLSLALLSVGATDLPERQRTLSATIEWSYELLTPSQRELHAALGVFAGGCTLGAAEIVCGGGDLLDEVTALVSGGLLRREVAAGEARFRMLQVVQEFALAQLAADGRADELGRRHAAWVAALAEEAEAELDGPEQAVWLERLERELANVRGALEWARTNDESELLLRITSALGRFWRAHGHMTEAREWLAAGLADGAGVESLTRARALWTMARQAAAQGDTGAAAPMLEEALSLFREGRSTRDVAFTLAELGALMRAAGDLDRAEKFASEAMAEARRTEDARALASALNERMALASARGDYEGARIAGAEMLTIRRELGDRMLLANAANNVGSAALVAGDYRGAEDALEEALALAIEVGDAIHIAAARAGLGEAALFAGDHARAATFLADALRDHIALDDSRGSAECMTALAGTACAFGDHWTAARYFGAAAELHATGSAGDPVETRVVDRFRDEVVAAVGPDAFAALEAAGRRLSPAAVLEDVRATFLNRALSPQ
jgi:predicted ATPase/class 3 adenylate cyclase